MGCAVSLLSPKAPGSAPRGVGEPMLPCEAPYCHLGTEQPQGQHMCAAGQGAVTGRMSDTRFCLISLESQWSKLTAVNSRRLTLKNRKSLQFICKKQAINFAPLQSAEGHKCSSKENGELNQDNKILLVPTQALNLNQVTVGNWPVDCPCTAPTSTTKRKGTPTGLQASHAASLVQRRKCPSKLLPF